MGVKARVKIAPWTDTDIDMVEVVTQAKTDFFVIYVENIKLLSDVKKATEI